METTRRTFLETLGAAAALGVVGMPASHHAAGFDREMSFLDRGRYALR